MKYFVVQHDAGNNRQGNPRRVFVVYLTATGDIEAAYDAGYQSEGAITNRHHKATWRLAGVNVVTTPREYREFVNLGERLREAAQS